MTSEMPENPMHYPTAMHLGGDSGLEEDDEIEAVLKGSELEKLMSSLSSEVEVFILSERQSPAPQENRACNVLLKPSVPSDFIAAKELILASGLMLEEDMVLLLEDENRTRTEGGYISRLQEVLLPCSCALAVFSSYRVMKNITWITIPSLLFSVGSTVYLSTKVCRSLRLKKTVEKLLIEIADLLSFMKRTGVAIKESYASVNSKVVLSNLRKTSPEVVDRYYSQIELDIAENLKTFTQFLIDIVHFTRDATRTVLSILGSNKPSKCFLIASCSDEELGLPLTAASNCQFVDISISKLEELSDQCILMQSEHLRALGMLLSAASESDRKKILDSVDRHVEMIGERLTLEKQRFSGSLFSKFREKRCCPSNTSKDVVLSQLNMSLTSLLCEVSCLKEYVLYKANITHEDEPYLELSMTNIETEMVECSRLFKQVRSSFGKKAANEDNLGAIAFRSPDNVIPTGIEVGRSDFSMDSEDRVYLGITDHEDSNEPSVDCETENLNPTYPKYLLNELKGVLEEKRVEFKQRESDAISKSDLIDVEDQFDLVALNKPLSKSADDVTEKATRSIIKKPKNTNSTKSVAWNVPSETTSLLNLDLTKSVAATAAKTSMLWKCSDEEFFGDEDDAHDASSTHS